MPYELELVEPFISGKKEYKTLLFKNRLKAAWTKHLPLDGNLKRGHFSPLIAGMTGFPPAVLDEMSAVDFTNAMGVVQHFLLTGLRVGEMV